MADYGYTSTWRENSSSDYRRNAKEQESHHRGTNKNMHPRDYSYQPSSNSEKQHHSSKVSDPIGIGETSSDHQSSHDPWSIPKFVHSRLNPPTDKEWMEVVLVLNENRSRNLVDLTTYLNVKTKANDVEKSKYDQIETESKRNLSRVEQLEKQCEDLKTELKHIALLNQEENTEKIKTAVTVTATEITKKLAKRFDEKKTDEIKNLKADYQEKIRMIKYDYERDIKRLEKKLQESDDYVRDLENDVHDLENDVHDLKNSVEKTENQNYSNQRVNEKFQLKDLKQKLWDQKTKSDEKFGWQKSETEQVKKKNTELLKNIEFLTNNSKSIENEHKKTVSNLQNQLEISNKENDLFRKKLKEPLRKKQCTTLNWNDDLEDF